FQRGGVRHGLAAFTALAAFATFLARRFCRAFCRHGAIARLAGFPKFAAFTTLAAFACLARFAVATAFAVLTRLPRFLA
ncbi:hypothetical protein, partial [Burkholderia gladioli]|uniref:hypothetical protein n=1 Tax=Burkholderia gladioli TaxID=28095 RepID=UPI00163E0948